MAMKMQHHKMYLEALLWYLLICISSADVITFPIHGSVYPEGHYNMTLTIGNKPYFLDIDTGSDLTWVQCGNSFARHYRAPHSPYLPMEKNIVGLDNPMCTTVQQLFQGVNSQSYCCYQIVYSDGTVTQGFLVNDTLNLPFSNGQSSVDLAFGCGFNQITPNPVHPPYLDGIIGLGKGAPSLLAQLRNQGMAKNIIGHCFSSNGDGYLVLGDIPIDVNISTWVPIFAPAMVYYLTKADILFGGELSDIRNLDIVFDSGSTYTYLVTQAYGALVDLIERYNDNNNNGTLDRVNDQTLPFCWKGTHPFTSVSDVSSKFLPIALNFTATNVQFSMDPKSYLIISNLGNVCLGILDGTEIGLGMNVIGDISFHDKWVIYDNEQGQVGWADAECDSTPS